MKSDISMARHVLNRPRTEPEPEVEDDSEKPVYQWLRVEKVRGSLYRLLTCKSVGDKISDIKHESIEDTREITLAKAWDQLLVRSETT